MPVTKTDVASKPSASNSSKGDWSDRKYPTTICLFDVDGTLSASRQTATPEMLALLARLRRLCPIGFVGGSDFAKQQEQLGSELLSAFDYCFSENGATAYRCGKLISQESFIGFLGEERYKKLVNFCLHYLADLEIPVKRGTFIEFRNGMINVSPIGRNCSQAERMAFDALDRERNIRQDLVRVLKERFASFGLQFSIGSKQSNVC